MSKRLEMVERLIDGGSADPFHWYARAMELRSLGRLDEALEAYGRVRERFPDYVPTYLMAGQVAEALGRTQVARDFLERGLEVARAAGEGKALAELELALDGLAD